MKIFGGYLFDLDGTVYLGDYPLPGAAETIRELMKQGCRCVFLSNKPIEPVTKYQEKLNAMGIPVKKENIINSSIVMAQYLKGIKEGLRIYLIGEKPLADELINAGCIITDNPLEAEYVVVSWDREFNYKKLNDAMQAICNGARLVATHPDRTCPVPGGVVPDAAGMIAAVEAVTGKKCEEIVGKPSPWTVTAALNRMGLPKEDVLMVGDRLETDIKMGKMVGIKTALTLTGVTRREDLEHSEIQPDYILETLADLLKGEIYEE
ncbi:HAD-IIA family hydrolase [Moorella sulfitireducens]|uniref:HAD-IIA family hydrolase n=1 Tax=Neomoorella sulfitireducens TaxID=2972948 RepID=UPI0021AD430D|nr:HAD-IIA family hydrolase [Moorella sulfitireducens]